jgi:hypothetical protein
MTVHASPASNRIRAVRRITWTEVADSRLTRMRGEGASLRAMAAAFGLSRSAIAERASRLGLVLPTRAPDVAKPTPPNPELQRDPLPAGHPISWGLITAGTCLEGTPYVVPTQPRTRRLTPKTNAAHPDAPQPDIHKQAENAQ